MKNDLCLIFQMENLVSIIIKNLESDQNMPPKTHQMTIINNSFIMDKIKNVIIHNRRAINI